MKNKIIAILWPATILIAIFCAKYYWPNTEVIKIVEEEVSETIYHIKDKTFKECTESSLNVNAKIKENVLYGECYDDCKSIDFKFKLKSKSKLKHFFVFGYIFQYETGRSFEIDYLYNFDFFQLGIGFIFSRTNPGINIKVQKGF